MQPFWWRIRVIFTNELAGKFRLNPGLGWCPFDITTASTTTTTTVKRCFVLLEPVITWQVKSGQCWVPGLLTVIVDHRDNTGGGDWVDDGCSRTPDGERRVRCTCDHMTHFAMLLQVKEKVRTLIGNPIEFLSYSQMALSSFLSSSYYLRNFQGNRRCSSSVPLEVTETKTSCWSVWLWLVIVKV